MHTDASGLATLEPAELLEAVSSVIEAGGDADITGASCFWHSILGVDAGGRPLTPILLWADRRSDPDAVQLRAELDEAVIHGRTGCMLRSGYWPARLRHLRRTEPAMFGAVSQWIGAGEWVVSQLAGHRATSVSMASGTGLLDIDRNRWDEELLDHLRMDATQLSTIGDTAEAGWRPTIGDGAASNLGCGAADGTRAAVNLGTSAAVRIVGDRRPEIGLFRYRIEASRALIGGAVSNAANLWAWAMRELALSADDTRAALAARPYPTHGLMVLPHWLGERAPHWREHRTGTIVGIRQSTTAVDIAQATIEGALYTIARIAEMVVPDPDTELVVSGGLSREGHLVQRLCNVLGRPVRVSVDPEASLRGAAEWCAEAIGVDLGPIDLGHLLEPDPIASARYRDARARFEELDGAT